MEISLLNRTAMLETKGDDEKTTTLAELGEALDPSHPQTNKTGSRAVLDNKAVMDVLLNLTATTRSARVVENALLVLLRLAWDGDNAKRLFQEHPSLVAVALHKLELGAENATEGVQIRALGVLDNLAFNIDNACDIVTKDSTLVALLVAKVDSNSEQVQIKALGVLQNLAISDDNKRKMVIKNPTLVPLLAAKVESNLEQVQIKALGVLISLVVNLDNKHEMVTQNPALVPLLVAKMGSNSKQVQIKALGVLQGLASNVDNAREMVTKNPMLVSLLVVKVGSNSEQVQVKALGVLQTLAFNKDNAREMATALVSLLVAKLESNSERVQTKMLGVLASLAANDDNAREMVAKNPTLVPLLVAKMRSDLEQAQVEALNVLRNLVCNANNARAMVAKNPALAFLFVAKVESTSEQVQVAALDLLRFLTANVDSATKNFALVPLLVGKLESNSEQVQVKALDVLCNLAHNVDNAWVMVTQHPMLVSLLVAKLGFDSEQVQVAALGVLRNLACDDDNKRDMVTENSTLVPLLVSKLESEQVQVKALRVLQSLACNDDNAREIVTKNPTLVPLLVAKVGSELEQLEALDLLYNLADNVENAREMITQHATFVPLLVAKVESDSEKVQVAALDVLCNSAQTWKSENEQKMTTLLGARLGTDNPKQVQVALSVLQSLANSDGNAREMVVKHATLVPLILNTLAFAASPAPLMFPVFPQALTDASAELDVVLKFRLLVDKVKVSTQQVIDKDALMDHNCGDKSVLECFQDLESMKLDVTQLEMQLGTEPFFAPPTPQQQDWVAKRNLARSNFLSSTTRLKQAILATSTAHLAEFDALKRQLGGAIDELELFVQRNNNLFSPDSTCDEAFKSIRIEAKQRELLHVFQVELVQGISSASPRSAIDKVAKCYLELILLCKMRTCGELDAMLQQARKVLQSPGVLSLTKTRLESSNEFISQNEELQAKLERANQIIAETVQHRNAFSKLRIKITEHELLRVRALDSGQDVVEIEGEMATLDTTRKSILSIKGELDKEMRHLASKPVASEENVVCHFPELFHRVTLEWEAKPVGRALSKADEIRALLLKSDLLLSQGVAEYTGPTARMKLTMKNVQAHLVKGAVANGSGAQVVIKRVAIKDSLVEIAKTKRILRASRIAAHPSILSCLGGIVVSEQEVKLVFPYMSGGDLAFWSQEHVRSVSRKLDVLTQVSDAIVALHRLDIFHRDIKPWNIVMDSSRDDAVPKLTDFEMSKETGVAQTFNTTRGLLGTTQGFRAPEVGGKHLFSATDYEKQDVYSFGATAVWLLGDEPAHEALFASCKSDDANLRPSSKEVYKELSKRRCIVCLDDDMTFKDCIVCPDGAHCFCKGCFDDWVKDQLQTELGRRKEIVACPSCTTNTPFPTRLYAHHIDLVLRSHKEKVESTVRQQVTTEMAAALEKERKLGVVALALRKIEDLLTSKCPKCKVAFVDFDNCCALTCASCNIQFCAFCHQGAAADAHSHVLRCEENPKEGELFCNQAVYAAQQKAFKTKLLKAFLDTLDGVTRDRVRESEVVREFYK